MKDKSLKLTFQVSLSSCKDLFNGLVKYFWGFTTRSFQDDKEAFIKKTILKIKFMSFLAM